MKKRIIKLSILLVGLYSYAQDMSDAMRYSQTNLNGTARFRGMSGAFGAVGGDLSAVSANPASSTIFLNNHAAVSLSSFGTRNQSDFFNTKTTQKNTNLDFNQAGGVFVFENGDSSSNWNKFALSINYDNVSSLDNDIYFEGMNKYNSIDKYFLSYANSIRYGSINNTSYQDLSYAQQQTALAYDSYLIDGDNTNSTYFTNISGLGNYYQTNSIQNRGNHGKVALNFSGQYNNKLMVGINLNIHFSDFTQIKRFTETNSNPKYATGSTVNEVIFNNQLYTYGGGFSFQAGAIYKILPEFRVGVTYESPTWIKLNDELTQSITTSGYGLNKDVDNSIYNTIINDPNTTFYFDPYYISTPGKWTFSGAYIFGKKGLISFDTTLKDYSNIDFSPSKDFKALNSDIINLLTTSTEFRIGAEKKINQWSIRGGYRFEGSPYKDKKLMSDLKGYSAGLGYNWGGTKLDFAYSFAQRTYSELMFNRGLTDAASISQKFNNFTVTLSFEL